jgi:hypothetical protein
MRSHACYIIYLYSSLFGYLAGSLLSHDFIHHLHINTHPTSLMASTDTPSPTTASRLSSFFKRGTESKEEKASFFLLITLDDTRSKQGLRRRKRRRKRRKKRRIRRRIRRIRRKKRRKTRKTRRKTRRKKKAPKRLSLHVSVPFSKARPMLRRPR